MLKLLILITAIWMPAECLSAPEAQAGDMPPAGVEAVVDNESRVHLFFSDRSHDYLSAERRRMDPLGAPSQWGLAIVEALIAGPRQSLVPTIPDGTKLRALYVSDDIAFVDLSRHVCDRHPGGVRSELLTIYSIVNSLVLNIPQIEAVKLLIEGREEQTLAGHIELRFPFEANMLMIR